MIALTLPGIETSTWQVRSKRDSAALAIFDGHYSCQTHPPGEVGPPGRKIVLVSPCERGLWCSHWPKAELTLDHLDAYRCSVYHASGAELASDEIIAAMDWTVSAWGDPPCDGWVTWVDTRKVASANPGFCFKRAGWWLDREWSHRYLVRLRA